MPRTPSPSGTAMTLPQALALAGDYWSAGQSQEAEAICRQVLAALPGQPDAAHLLGIIAHAHGRRAEAIGHLRTACAAPGVPAEYFSNLGEMCRQDGRLGEAEEALRRAVALADDGVGSWNNLGIVLQEAGRLAESRACLERVLALAPDFSQAHNNLANTLARSGGPREALPRYRAALTLDPAYAEARSNLAVLLKDLGRHDEALEQARAAITLDPRHAQAYLTGAAIESARGRPADALAWLAALLDFAPRFAPALAAQAEAHRQLGRWDLALRSARAAVDADPASAAAWLVLGDSLQAMGDSGAALDALRKAVALGGGHQAVASTALGVLLIETGRTDEARTILEAACAGPSPRATALHALGTLVRATPDNGWLARLRAGLGDPDRLSPDERIVAQFALAKALLETGEDDEEAFDVLDTANLLKRETFSYDAAATGRWIDSIAAAFPAERGLVPADGADPGAGIVFVVGMPRSGGALVERILCTHPAVAGSGGRPVLPQLMETVRRTDGTPIAYPDFLAAAADADLAALGRLYRAEMEARAAGRHHLIDGTPTNFLYLGAVRRMLPGARIIHVRRDPVDCCFSCYATLFRAEHRFTYEMTELGRFHRAYERTMAHWRAMLAPADLLEVDYEALVSDADGQARRLFAFLGLGVDPAGLAPATSAIHHRSVGRGRSYTRHLGPLLATLGRAPEAGAGAGTRA